MKNIDIAVIGGDRRTACMAQMFTEKGRRVVCYGTVLEETAKDLSNTEIHQAKTLRQAVENTPVIVCGLPLEYEGNLYLSNRTLPIATGELQRCLRKGQKIFAGMIPDDFKKKCEERQILCYDFMKEEPLCLFQAIATAEGAIAETLLHTGRLIHHSNILVLGYGRCGKTLAEKLSGLKAFVTVSSKDPAELALAESLGKNVLPLLSLPSYLSSFDFIYNTIPACILDRSMLSMVRPDVCIVDIASKRIGVDYEACEALHLNAVYCPHLPGKYASASCAQRLTDFVIKKTNSE